MSEQQAAAGELVTRVAAGDRSALSEFGVRFGGLATEVARRVFPHAAEESLHPIAQRALQACVDELPPVAEVLALREAALESWVGAVCGRLVHEAQAQIRFEATRRRAGELLPEQLPDHEFFAVRAFTRPAELLGGDYYDACPRGDGGLLLLLADVAGHGAPAALLISAVKCAFRLSSSLANPRETLAEMNRALRGVLPPSCFVAAGLVQLGPTRGQGEFVNAGMDGATVVSRQQKTLQALELTGDLLGLFDRVEFQQIHLLLHEGDSLFLCTDGVLDLVDPAGERFGKQRLRCLLERALSDGRDLFTSVCEALDEFGGGRAWPDDTSFLIVEAR